MNDAILNKEKQTDTAAAAPSHPAPILFLHGIDRHYRQGNVTLHILRAAELAVWPGQAVALVAPSGAGKSTLLHIAGLLEQPDGGDVYVDQIATSGLSDAERTRIRRIEIGFVYQFHHLLMEFSAIENVIMPQMVRGLSRAEASKRATDLLSYLGLKERLTHRPAELSGGEQQRAALGRALVRQPNVFLLDEPLAHLDPRLRAELRRELHLLHARICATMVYVTHDQLEAMALADRLVVLHQGVIQQVARPAEVYERPRNRFVAA